MKTIIYSGRCKDIAVMLQLRYRYYDDVYFDFVVEAVENTITDFMGEIKSLEEFHEHITQNYI